MRKYRDGEKFNPEILKNLQILSLLNDWMFFFNVVSQRVNLSAWMCTSFEPEGLTTFNHIRCIGVYLSSASVCWIKYSSTKIKRTWNGILEKKNGEFSKMAITILSRVLLTIDGFGLVIGFIDHIKVVTRNYYYTIVDFHITNHSTLSLLNPFPVVAFVW
jgi:hypothetical protein